MNKKIIALSVVTLLVCPLAVLAFNYPAFNPGSDVDAKLIMDNVLGFIWPIFIAFAILMFIVAGLVFLLARGEPGKIATARLALLWGVIGVAVGVLAFSIPFLVRSVLGV